MTDNAAQTLDLITQAIDNLRAANRAFTAEARKHAAYSTPNGTYLLCALRCEDAANTIATIEPLIESLDSLTHATDELERTNG